METLKEAALPLFCYVMGIFSGYSIRQILLFRQGSKILDEALKHLDRCAEMEKRHKEQMAGEMFLMKQLTAPNKPLPIDQEDES